MHTNRVIEISRSVIETVARMLPGKLKACTILLHTGGVFKGLLSHRQCQNRCYHHVDGIAQIERP